jgi:UV DNA damage repair endonuclease
MAAKTWGDIKPTCHHSNSKKNHEDEKVSRVAHSSWYYTPFKDLGLELDVVLECKQKERALLKYRKDFQ